MRSIAQELRPATARGRLIQCWHRAGPEVREAGRRWYPEANAWCEANGVPPGVVAALSPQCGWGENKRRALQLCRTGSTSHTSLQIGKALAILEGQDYRVVLRGAKELAFADELTDPNGPANLTVTDRHHLDLMGVRHKWLERVGAYGMAHEVTADCAGDPLVRVTIGTFQATVWCQHRIETGAEVHG